MMREWEIYGINRENYDPTLLIKGDKEFISTGVVENHLSNNSIE